MKNKISSGIPGESIEFHHQNRDFAIFIWHQLRAGEGKKLAEKREEKILSLGMHQHTPTWRAMLFTRSTSVCMCVVICDVMSCRGKLKFQLNFLRNRKDLFSLCCCWRVFFFSFSFCRFQRLATMAATSQWSRSSAFPSRKRRIWDRLSAFSSHTVRWMWWVASSKECAYKHRKMFTRTLDEAWPRQLRTRKTNGELSTNTREIGDL